MSDAQVGPLTKLLSGKRTGTALTALGSVCAGLAALLVVSSSARSSVQAAPVEPVEQKMVVIATKDIPEFSAIRADAVTLKPFPATYVLPGAALKVEDVVGKVATTRITGGQLVLGNEVAPVEQAGALSARIPEGKVAFWMPLPDLISRTGGIRAGDHVDILLTLNGNTASNRSGGLVTQTTLQAVEVFFVGAPPAPAPAAASGASGGMLGAPAPAQSQGGGKAIAFLLDPQDALTAKFIRDSGGTVDLVLRSRGSMAPFATSPVTTDTLMQRFQFRLSGQ